MPILGVSYKKHVVMVHGTRQEHSRKIFQHFVMSYVRDSLDIDQILTSEIAFFSFLAKKTPSKGIFCKKKIVYEPILMMKKLGLGIQF